MRTPPGLNAIFRPSVQPYLISCFRYTPKVELAKLRVPVLIVQGTHDFQVMPTEATLQAAAVPRATTLTVEGMNYVLKMAPADRSHETAGAYVVRRSRWQPRCSTVWWHSSGAPRRSTGDDVGPRRYGRLRPRGTLSFDCSRRRARDSRRQPSARVGATSLRPRDAHDSCAAVVRPG